MHCGPDGAFGFRAVVFGAFALAAAAGGSEELSSDSSLSSDLTLLPAAASASEASLFTGIDTANTKELGEDFCRGESGSNLMPCLDTPAASTLLKGVDTCDATELRTPALKAVELGIGGGERL